MKVKNKEKIERIIKRYKMLRKKNIDTHIEYCVSQKTLKDAIKIAVESIDSNNKIHGHQRRVGRKNLNAFAEKLIMEENKLKNIKTFNEIFNVVQNVKSEKIGELAIYDTAHRIGCYLNIFPEEIYLHSGTRVGARNLLGKVNKNNLLNINELPEVFQNSDLTASEIEDIFCIYKNEFKNLLE